MDSVNKTCYIPLYGKAYVSRKGLFLHDKKAEEIWAAEGFALRGKSRSKWLAYYMGIRSAVFDQWLRDQLAGDEDAVVVHIGCGLDSRNLRVTHTGHLWYDVDFPEVILERRKYFTETGDDRMIAGDARESAWLAGIPEDRHAIVVMEGVSMYLTPDELKTFTASLCAHFDRLSLLLDCYTVRAARLSAYKNPINDVGVTKVYGMDDPAALQSGLLSYVKEHEMTPQRFIDALQGAERFIFSKVFAGRLSKTLYRLHEYRKS